MITAERHYPGKDMVAPAGKRLSGPGTRSKNPSRYDAVGKALKERAQ